MAIILRAVKGSALTLNELDNNFTSFFYSASLNAAQTQLTFHRSGSASSGISGSTTINIPLSPYTGSTPPASGNTSTIQYNSGGGNLAGDDDFKFNVTNNAVEVGGVSSQATDGIAVQNKKIRIKSNQGPNTSAALVLHGNGANLSGSLTFDPSSVNSSLGSRYDLVLRNESNNTTDANNNILFYIDKLNSSAPIAAFYRKSGIISLRYASKTIADINLSGSLSIQGNGTSTTRLTKIFNFENVNRINNNSGTNLLSGTVSRGTIIEGPEQGHVVIGLHDQSATQGLSIISSPVTGSSLFPTYDKMVAFFAGNGNVGIGTKTPTKQLHVEGNMIVTGNTTLGNSTSDDTQVTGDLDVDVNLNVDGNVVIDGTVTLNSVGNAATANHYDYLVVSESKIVKQVDAAPIPLGGIIMWSGNMLSIPTGFALCDGSTVSGSQTPDLRDKFIAGASNVGANSVPKTTIDGSGASISGGTISHSHGTTTGGHTLTTAEIPAHAHAYKDGYYMEINNPGTGNGGTVDGADDVSSTGVRYKGSGDSDTDNKFIYYRNMVTNNTGSGASHSHSISTQQTVPPFYALAYIMFVG